MSDVDCLTQIETEIRASLEARLTLAKRVLGPEDLPAKEAYLPAVFVDLGDQVPTYLTGPGGYRDIEVALQVDIVVILDMGMRDFAPRARALANEVRAVMADFESLGLPLDDVRLVAAKPQSMPSEKGSQGGYHLAYLVTFMSGEATPGAFA